MKTIGSVFLSIALVSLLIASFSPLFVITKVNGETDMFFVKFSVDFEIGSGLFHRDRCYGHVPEEDTLNRWGLSCSGVSQTLGCGNSPLSSKTKAHCEHFKFMQTLQIISMIATGVALVTHSRSYSLVTTILVTAALITSTLVLYQVIHTPELMEFKPDEVRIWECRKLIGEVQLCHGFGSSFYLQILALASLAIVEVLSARESVRQSEYEEIA